MFLKNKVGKKISGSLANFAKFWENLRILQYHKIENKNL
jgi:hypothetical protein